MTGGKDYVGIVGEIVGRHHRMSDFDSESGSFELHGDDRAVRVVLDPDLLAEFVGQIGVKHVAMAIEEIFESDIFRSLLEIRLGRSGDGRIALLDRRGPARRSFPPVRAEDGYWSADRPGT